MRIAVIGGTGVVGRHTVEALRRAGHARISRIRGSNHFSVRELSASVCLVTHKVVGVTRAGQAAPFSLRSSIWRHTGER